MFQGTIPTPLRAMVHEHAATWPTDMGVHVGCSGNLTIERTLAPLGRVLHSNDVNPYSCALGWHFAGQPLDYHVKDASWEQLGWLAPYLDGGAGTLATLMLGTRWLDWVGKTTPYHQRMVAAYREQWPRVHAETVAKLQAVTLRLASFYPGDVRDYLAQVAPEYPVVMFPPFWCLERSERILTADLQWVPSGDLIEGQQILTFDEHPQPGSRVRRWRYGTVTYSQPAVKECVRVHLDNGDSVVCTADHPWLAARYMVGQTIDWITAENLIRPSRYPTRDPGPIDHYVFKVLDPWTPATSFDDGWLSGILDGEGTVSMPSGALGHGSARVAVYQVPGRVADQAEALLRGHGFDLDVRAKTPGEHSKKVVHQLTVAGGFSEMLRALGTFRPVRLIDRLRDDLDVSRQTVRVNGAGGARVRVVAVEPVGLREIQSISTSTGTYIGEGYLMHNSKGYEVMFRGLETHFDWPEPDYRQFTDEGKQEIIDLVIDRPHWLLGLHYLNPDLEPYRAGFVQATPRTVPIHVYARPGLPRVAGPRQQVARIPMQKIGPTDPVGDRLSLHPISSAQLSGLRSMFLDRRIAPGEPLLAVAVASDGKLIGAFAYKQANFDPTGVYLMSDFPIGWSQYRRLAKLIVLAAVSRETQLLVQRTLSRRIDRWSTTAFTDNPTSGKYGRGIPGVRLHSRKPCTTSDHQWMLAYEGPMGQWTLAEALTMWLAKDGKVLR